MIISQSGIKRKLANKKPYLLILSRDEARALCNQLQRATTDDFNYGSVTIYPLDWCDTPSDCPPLDWTER